MDESEFTLVRGLKGLANIMGCGRTKAFQLKESGRIPYVKDGGVLLFDPQKVLAALEQKARV